MRTWPAPGSGTDRSTRRRLPGAETSNALYVLFIFLCALSSTFHSMPHSIFFSLHPFTKIGSAILQLHAIPFTTREKAHYVATDQTHLFALSHELEVVRFECKTPL